MDVNIRLKAFNEKVFKAYDIRGLYPEELDLNTIEIFVEGAAQYFKSFGGKKCLVGEDVRWSSSEISNVVINKLRERGIDVVNIGAATTPLFAYSLYLSGMPAGIMITASHNSVRYNGFKVYKGVQPLNEKNGYPEIKEIIKKGITDYSGPKGSLEEKNFLKDYISFLLERVNLPKDIKAVFDAGGGAVGPILSELLKSVEKIHDINLNLEPDPSMVVREPNPLLPEAQVNARKAVLENKAEVGFIFDPDGDRIIVLDELGNVIRGDAVLWLLAKKFVQPGESVVYDVRASRVLVEDLAKDGIKCHKSRVGHSFFKELMRQEDSALGGELSGHFYFKEFFFSESSILAALKVLHIISSSKAKLSELLKPYFIYTHSGEKNFAIKDREGLMSALEEKYADAERDYFDGITFRYKNWWFNARFSNTENVLRLVLEANDEKTFHEKEEELFTLFASRGIEPA
ncbi:phosphomannomutase/phosphoglucomutase [Candidatus Giovannonibacteria bacterium]|nr:phosphomannomutase/phosphoglucomutase [Candidatus Giovannonibacteria bacterium]